MGYLKAILMILSNLLKWFNRKAEKDEQKKEEIKEGVHSDNDSDFLNQL